MVLMNHNLTTGTDVANNEVATQLPQHAHKQRDASNGSIPAWRISIAPMVSYSTRQMRYLWRQLCASCLLYTEMIPVASMLRGNKAGHLERLLGYSECEKPLALQVASNSPTELKQATRLAIEWGYDEINLNTGCPSCKLTQAGVGAYMIKQPQLTAECIAAMKSISNAGGISRIAVTLKTRLGVDDWDDDEKLHYFIEQTQQAGVDRVIIHARKAWLKGLNPAQNRNTPPLDYERVARLKKAFPDLPIILNGGINNIGELTAQLDKFDGVMIGRAAYRQPLMLQEIAHRFFAEKNEAPTIEELLERQLNYAQERWRGGEAFRYTGMHLLNIYNGKAGARRYRQELSKMLRESKPPSVSEVCSFLPCS